MNNYFLKIPLDLSKIAQGEPVSTCSRQESIAQFIMLIITSKYGELPGSDDFGSEIWELEFLQLANAHSWEERVKESIEKAIVKYEKRLKEVKVTVSLDKVEDIDMKSTTKSYGVRKQAKIFVNGIMKGTDQHFNFNTKIFISPISQ
ncbi:MAG: GPW/gp25 family protein [Bacteroidota bacterium]